MWATQATAAGPAEWGGGRCRRRRQRRRHRLGRGALPVRPGARVVRGARRSGDDEDLCVLPLLLPLRLAQRQEDGGTDRAQRGHREHDRHHHLPPPIRIGSDVVEKVRSWPNGPRHLLGRDPVRHQAALKQRILGAIDHLRRRDVAGLAAPSRRQGGVLGGLVRGNGTTAARLAADQGCAAACRCGQPRAAVATGAVAHGCRSTTGLGAIGACQRGGACSCCLRATIAPTRNRTDAAVHAEQTASGHVARGRPAGAAAPTVEPTSGPTWEPGPRRRTVASGTGARGAAGRGDAPSRRQNPGNARLTRMHQRSGSDPPAQTAPALVGRPWTKSGRAQKGWSPSSWSSSFRPRGPGTRIPRTSAVALERRSTTRRPSASGKPAAAPSSPSMTSSRASASIELSSWRSSDLEEVTTGPARPVVIRKVSHASGNGSPEMGASWSSLSQARRSHDQSRSTRAEATASVPHPWADHRCVPGGRNPAVGLRDRLLLARPAAPGFPGARRATRGARPRRCGRRSGRPGRRVDADPSACVHDRPV